MVVGEEMYDFLLIFPYSPKANNKGGVKGEPSVPLSKL